jgi:outer membrane protein
MTRISILVALAAVLLSARATAADTLWEIYQMARQNDPQLREAEANRLAIREVKPQARGALLPQLDGTTSLGQTEVDTQRTGVGFGSVESTTIAANRNDNLDWQVQLRQTVFRWDQWVRFRQSDKQVLQADVDYRVAELALYTRVAAAYFNVLAAEDTLEASIASREAIGRQLEQAEKRFEVGLIAITDVQEAQAAYDQALADEIIAKRQLANSKEVLREIIGDYPSDLAKPRADIPLISPAPADESQWVELALQQNLSLQSAQLGAAIARDDISIARSGHLPTIDLVGSHSDTRQRGDQNTLSIIPSAPTLGGASAGPSEFDQETDSIRLEIAVPIFSGGITSSRVRQAVYQHRAAKERLERIARETERLTRDAFLAVTTDISRVKALRQALTSATTALQATEAGFEVGTRTTVDVLESRRQLYLAQTNYARSRYDYIVNVLRLKEAAGTLDEEDVREIDAWLVPAEASAPSAPTPPAGQGAE